MRVPPPTILGRLRLWGLPAGQQLWIEGFQMAVFANCTIRSGDNGNTGYGEGTAHALVALSSDIGIDDCLVQPGIPGAMTVSPPRSVFVTNGRMLVVNRNNQIVAPVTLAGTASLEFDGALTAAEPAFAAEPQWPESAQRGGTIQWIVADAPGSVGVAARSLGSQPLALPALLDTLLFTAPHPTASMQDAFVVPAGRQATLSLQVPNLPQLVGAHVLQQAAGWLGQPTQKATGVVGTVVSLTEERARCGTRSGTKPMVCVDTAASTRAGVGRICRKPTQTISAFLAAADERVGATAARSATRA